MPNVICKICQREFQVKPYRVESAVACSRACRGIFVGRKAIGSHRPSHPAWNKGMKGIHLSPASEFKKGSEPWNKNLKGLHLSPESEFKKGRIGDNRAEIGTITVRVDSQGKPRNWIKTEHPNVHVHLSRYLWAKEHGPIPDGMVIHHVNEISNDDRLDNYDMLTKAEHARVHQLSKL